MRSPGPGERMTRAASLGLTRAMPRLSSDVLAAATIVALSLALLLPGLFRGPIDDQAIFTTIGDQLARGNLPYVAAWDHKPPAVYLLAGMLSLLPGPTWPWLWVASVAALAGTGYLLLPLAGWRATLIAVICMGIWPVSGGGGYSEAFAVLPGMAAYRLGTSGKHFWAGVLFGASMLFSFQMAGLGLALAALAWTAGLLTVVAGAALVVLLTAGAAYATGALAAMIDVLIGYNRAYAALDRSSDLRQIWRTLIALLPLAAVLPLRRRLTPWPALIWAIGTLVQILVQGRLFPHYTIPMVPPLAILAGPAFERRGAMVVGAHSGSALALGLYTSSAGIRPDSRAAVTTATGHEVADMTARRSDPRLGCRLEHLPGGRPRAGRAVPLHHAARDARLLIGRPGERMGRVRSRPIPPAIIVDAEAANPHWPDGEDFQTPAARCRWGSGPRHCRAVPGLHARKLPVSPQRSGRKIYKLDLRGMVEAP